MALFKIRDIPSEDTLLYSVCVFISTRLVLTREQDKYPTNLPSGEA